ncbi:uncharacterized protein BDV14DRAFT_190378 [Aspergillus stella-maris]|uniref:uncharacterized protein n=1 Tax=Aspergillus stella-maris TaxID=1810926 RepID=UPI003CCD0E81
MGIDQASTIPGVSWTLASISIALVGLRVFIRVFLTRRRGWDDFFIVNAIICSALAHVGVSYDLGKHLTAISNPSNRANAVKYTVIAPNFCVVSTTTGKISGSWNILAIIVIIGFCRPIKKLWIPDTPGTCLSLQLQLIGGTSQAAFNAFADLALAFFPVIIFRKVQMHRWKKIGVVAILGAEILYAGLMVYQMYVIIICATLPTLPQCYNAIRNKRSTSYNSALSAGPQSGNASLFETQEEGERNGNQESILVHKQACLNRNIKKTTEVHIVDESLELAAQENDNPKYFP